MRAFAPLLLVFLPHHALSFVQAPFAPSVARRGAQGAMLLRAPWARSSGGIVRFMSDEEDYDYPSDYDAGDEAAGVTARQPTTLGDNPELREKIKQEISVIAAATNRGQLATQEEKDTVCDLTYQLEALNPIPETTNSSAIGGTWELIYSDVQPFRSSPFFMAVGTLFGDDKERAETAFALHRAATANGEIGRVRQTITESELVSEVDLRVGLVSGIPFSLKTTVVSKGDIRPISDTTLGISVSSTTVKNNNLFKFLDEAVEVPVGQAYSTLRGSVPEVKLSTYYLDDSMRVTRTDDEHYFIYSRV